MSAPGPKNLRNFQMHLWSYTQDKIVRLFINEDGFNPNKYFDLIENNWVLEKFPEHISKAHEICTGKPSKFSRVNCVCWD